MSLLPPCQLHQAQQGVRADVSAVRVCVCVCPGAWGLCLWLSLGLSRHPSVGLCVVQCKDVYGPVIWSFTRCTRLWKTGFLSICVGAYVFAEHVST